MLQNLNSFFHISFWYIVIRRHINITVFIIIYNQFSSVAQSDSLWPHGLKHARLLCPSPNPGAYSNSCPLCEWCHPTISSFVIPFSFCLQSFPASGSFKWVTSSHEVAKVLELQHQSFHWYSGLISFRMDWLGLLAVLGTLKSLLQHHSSKASILQCSAFFIVQLSHPYMTTGKTIALTRALLGE